MRENYPSDAHPQAGSEPKQHRRTTEEVSQSEGTRPQRPRVGAAPDAPGNANDPQEGRPVREPGTNPKYAEAKERSLRDKPQPEDDRTYEAGDPEMDNDDRPMDTGTPGGMLGTASREELTRSPEAESSKADERLETDQR